MRKILMGSVASIALLGFAAGFPQPILAQSDAPAASTQDQNAQGSQDQNAQGGAAQSGDTKNQGNMPAASQGDANQTGDTQNQGTQSQDMQNQGTQTGAGQSGTSETGTAATTSGAGGAATVGQAPPEEMRYRSVEGAEAGSITLPGEMTTDQIVGISVYDANNESIGDVEDLLLDENGEVSKVLVDVGGFLGMGEHRVALDLDQINFTEADGALRAEVDMTEDQLEAMPAYTRSEDNYWVAGPVASPAMPSATPPATETAATTAPASTERAPVADTDYRSWDETSDVDMKVGDMSAQDVLGATVYGPDGNNVGEVADLQIGPDKKIDRMIVDVGGFLGMGVHTVALPVDEVKMASVDGEQRITVDATKDELKAMPAYEQDSDGNWVMSE